MAELLTIERHGLNLTDAFQRARPGNAAAPEAPGNVLMACWFGPVKLSAVRSRVRAHALGLGLRDGQARRFVLAVHEAMVNAVRHAGGRGQLLLWHRDDQLWCEISDHGPGIPAEHTYLADAGSIGLQMIRRACTSLEITTDSSGTRLLLGHRLNPPS